VSVDAEAICLRFNRWALIRLTIDIIRSITWRNVNSLSQKHFLADYEMSLQSLSSYFSSIFYNSQIKSPSIGG
jgi:hypothetical protein